MKVVSLHSQAQTEEDHKNCQLGQVINHPRLNREPPECYCYCCGLHHKQCFHRSSCADVMSVLDAGGAMDIEKLREWAEKSQLDPNDPRNASFFYFIKVRGYNF